jgi:hypothetical protein
VIFTQTILGGHVMASEEIDTNINKEKLSSYRSQTTISGVYLDAWNHFVTYSKSKNINVDLKNYLITFTENETEYLIHFKRPRTKMILGGGDGSCRISKVNMEIIEFKLSK